MALANDVTEQTLRRLAETRAERPTVLSLYVDLDPARFATAPARQSEIDSLLDGAHREIEREEREHYERADLRAALERARERLPADGEWADGARAVALFISKPLELDELLRLPRPVSSSFVIAEEPFIAPLAETGPAGRVCVALVDERFARIMRGSAEGLREVVSFGDDVHGRHQQGGWSQARYQRSIRRDIEAHLQHVSRVLGDLLRIAPYGRLLIASTEELWPRVVERLPAEVRGLLHDERLVLDVADASMQDVHAAASTALSEEQRAREDAVLAALREHLGREGDARAAAGIEDVLFALVERRVAALAYEAGMSVHGVICPRCGWMGADGERCPADSGSLDRRENIVDDAVRAAVSQSADVLAMRERPELGPLGGIAATLRF